MPSTPLAASTDVEPTALQAVLRHAVFAGTLVVLLVAVSVLPGAGRTLPGTGLTVGGLGTATVAAGLVATLLYAVRSVADLVESALRGPPDVVDDLAAAAGYAVGFLAVLVAHWGLTPAALPLLGPERAWAYDAAFLGVALLPTAALAHRLVRNADVLAASLTWTVLGRPPSREGATGGERA